VAERGERLRVFAHVFDGLLKFGDRLAGAPRLLEVRVAEVEVRDAELVVHFERLAELLGGRVVVARVVEVEPGVGADDGRERV
jgi:hypothetical protein